MFYLSLEEDLPLQLGDPAHAAPDLIVVVALDAAVGQHDAATQHEGEHQLVVVEQCNRHNPGRRQIKANLSRMSSIYILLFINTSETAFKHL